MDDKYNVSKPKKPETRSEILAERIEQLVKLRDAAGSPAERQKYAAEITKLFAQFERLKL